MASRISDPTSIWTKGLSFGARLTGRLPVAVKNEFRFVRRMQSVREPDEKGLSFKGTKCPILSGVPVLLGDGHGSKFAFLSVQEGVVVAVGDLWRCRGLRV